MPFTLGGRLDPVPPSVVGHQPATRDPETAVLLHRFLGCDVVALFSIHLGTASLWSMTWTDGPAPVEQRTSDCGALAPAMATCFSRWNGALAHWADGVDITPGSRHAVRCQFGVPLVTGIEM